MIREVQTALKAKGFDPGPIDGIYGDKTRDAVRAFQKVHFLFVDGAIGPATLGALGLFAESFLDPTAFYRWAPDAVPNTLPALEAAIRTYPDIADPVVLDDWLGQMWVESLGFSRLVENLNYSVEGLRATFGRHRISDAECKRYGRKPGRPADQKAIANIIYGGEWGRKNLGNIHPNDGWDMRGSGFKQITGRRNIEASGFSAEELRTNPFASALAAADFFVDAGCVAPARRGAVSEVTKKINGGSNGLRERGIKTAEARGTILS